MPATPLFLTGSSGFVGRRVLSLLSQAKYADVRLLIREPARLSPLRPLPPGWRVVPGDLTDPDPWAAQLEGVETVLHLAGATGKASRAEHFTVNVKGTEQLLERAWSAGVKRFLYVSSNAVTYTDRPHYHYAEAKTAAELVVRNTELDWLIVRPTIVLGPGSPVGASLRRLASLPIPLLFGAGDALVQPVHVDDLARTLVATLALHRWDGAVIAVGGPEVVSIGELLARMRNPERPADTRFLGIPLRPLRGLLALLEPLLLPLLPFTAGQLALFANPSLIHPDPLLDRLPEPRLGIAAMLSGTE